MLEVPVTCPTASCVTINATQGDAITPTTLTGSGGCGGPYTFSATGLPTGLTMSSSGTISGTPTANGTFPYTVTITDSCGNKGTFNCSVTVLPPVISTCAIISAEQGVAITNVTLTASGGCGGPYTFSAVGLPQWLTMSSVGTISGTPTESGTFGYTVTITDNCNNTGTLACSVTVNPPLSVTCASVSVGEVGLAFDSGPMTVTGGTAPYTFSIVGTLPAGLSLNPSTGAITGTPTASGSFSVQVTDALGATSAGCLITINTVLSVTCATVSVGEVGVAFNSGPMTVSGGTAPYTFSIVGTLPAGLSLNPSNGAITGTPTASGSFSVVVTDALGATSAGCAITINTVLSVTCATVSVGEVGVAFNSGPMTVTGGTAPYTYSISGTLPAGLTLNTSTGAVTGTPTASGSFYRRGDGRPGRDQHRLPDYDQYGAVGDVRNGQRW